LQQERRIEQTAGGATIAMVTSILGRFKLRRWLDEKDNPRSVERGGDAGWRWLRLE
jgi:hypothetical protein